MQLSFINSTLAYLFLVGYFRLSLRTQLNAFKVSPWLLVALSLFGAILGSSFMFLALDKLDLGVTLILEKLQPIFVFILAGILLKERLPSAKVKFVVLALFASYFVNPSQSQLSLTKSIDFVGVVYVVLAALSWSISSVIGRKVMSYQDRPELVTVIRFGLCSIALSPCLFIFDFVGPLSNPYTSTVVVLTALVSAAIGFLLFYRGLKYVSASISGVLELVTPVAGLVLGVCLLGEELSLSQFLAALSLFYAVYRIY